MLTPRQNRSASVMGAVCRIRTELLDRLAGAVELLGRAKLSLEMESSELLRQQLEGLRAECVAIRRELESHRAGHGC